MDVALLGDELSLWDGVRDERVLVFHESGVVPIFVLCSIIF